MIVAAVSTALILIAGEIMTAWCTPRWAARGVRLNHRTLAGKITRLGAAAAAGATMAATGWVTPSQTVATATATWVAVLLCDSDLASMKMPREVCWAGFAVGLVCAVTDATSAAGWINLGVAAIGLVVAPFVLAALTRGGLGLGDIRLLAMVTGCFGWWVDVTVLLAGLVLACLVGAVVHLVGTRTGWGTTTNEAPDWAGQQPLHRPRRLLPFGPSLMVGFTVVLLWSVLTLGDQMSMSTPLLS